MNSNPRRKPVLTRRSNLGRRHLFRSVWLFTLLCLPAAPVALRAQGSTTKFWGVNGAGGSGVWNDFNANWYNGTANGTWAGGAAIFGGTGGTVTVPFNQRVTSMTFNVPGYTLQAQGFSSTGSLTITTNADGAIYGTSLSPGNGNFIKAGNAALVFDGYFSFGPNALTQISAGEIRVLRAGYLGRVSLADTAGAILTLGQGNQQPYTVYSLTGGGANGGVVRPGSTAGTVTLQVVPGPTTPASTTFNGTLQDNGANRLALSVFTTGKSQILAGANTYSGPTTVSRSAELRLAGNGSALNTDFTVNAASLTLDNVGTALNNRISDTTDVALNAGRLSFGGNAQSATAEVAGAVRYAGNSQVSAASYSAQAAGVSFAGASRLGHGTLGVILTNFSGGDSAFVTAAGLANGANGIIAPYITASKSSAFGEWATVGADGTIQPLAAYATDPLTATAGDHVKLTGGGTTTLPASDAWNTLNLQGSTGNARVLDLGAGHTLTLAAGGILSSGAPNVIQNGTLAAGGELVVNTYFTAINGTDGATLTIASALVETVPGTVLTKTGINTLILTGNNTLSGDVYVEGGILSVSSDANLGRGGAMHLEGGNLQINGSFVSAKGFTSDPTLGGPVTVANGYNATFGGPSVGPLYKFGAGTLTLANANVGTATVTAGTLALPNVRTGSVTVSMPSGTPTALVAAGTLQKLMMEPGSVLDVGGAGAYTLTIDQFTQSFASFTAITIRLDLGANAQDRLSIGQSAFFTNDNGSIAFTIGDLGGLTTGVDYNVLTLPNGTSPIVATSLVLSTESLANGYRGTFMVNGNLVLLNFSAVPEPSTVSLLAGILVVAAGGRWLLARRRAAVRTP